MTANMSENQLNYNSIKQTFDDIIKSNEDKRQYKAFILNNGLKVLLISDVVTDKSAAALEVNVGFLSDPRELQGLAHFLEHMLFLGTKKYAEENEYQQYLSRNAGSCNAYTSESGTTYYFDVATDALEGALDRFAQFFIEPLFTESATDRELNAVHSEHQKNIVDDFWRIDGMKNTLSDPKHDFSKFGTGNMETLKETPLKEGIDVRQALLDFHKKWYSANIMSLVVLGKETMNELIEVVIPLFSQIINKDVTPPEWTTHPYSDEYLRKEVSIVPIEDSRKMEILFPIPDLNAYYKSQPDKYLSNLIGHEGPGSLLSELKIRGLCNILNAGSWIEAKGFAFFELYLELTVNGIERTDEIIELIFQYINLLKNEGPKEWIFVEDRGLKQINFQFKDKERPFYYVVNLVSNPRKYPGASLNEWLSVGSLLEEYRPELITETLDLLTPNRMNVKIISKNFSGKTDSTEKWYGTQYKVEDIPQEKIDLWTNCGLNERLSLPPINDFIPTNFDLSKREEKSEEFPQIIRNTDFSRVWYLQDNQYLKPKLFYAFKLTNPLAYSSPFNSCSTSMFTKLFLDSLEEYAYAASLTEFNYSFYRTDSGIILKMGGYNDKLKLFLETFLKKLFDFKIDPKRFEIIKDKYVRRLNDYTTLPLYILSQYYSNLITSERFWSYEDRADCMSEVTVESLMQFIPQLLSRFHIEALIHGNIEKSEALKVCDMFEDMFKNSHFKTRPISLSQHYRNREIQLKDGTDSIFETTNAIHNTKIIEIYFQTGVQEIISNAFLQLVNQLLSEPFFNTLRTKEQLGYIAWSTTRQNNGVQGLNLLIQSDYRPSYLNERIEAFISWSEQYLNDMKSEEFETEKQSLITRKLEKEKQLLDYSYILWNEIDSKQYLFNREQNEVNAIKDLTKEDVLSYFKKYLSINSSNRKKLTVSISSADSLKDKDSTEGKEGLFPAPELKESVKIGNIEEFKNRSALYPLPEPMIDVHKIK